MTDLDSQSERHRLAKVYAGLADEELLEIAEDEASLTPTAREALRSEMNKRNLSADPEKSVQPKFVLLRRLRDTQEIALTKSILDAAGIEYLVSDEQTVAMSVWAPSFDGGGAKLFVKEQDAEFASTLLSQESV